MYLIMKLVLTVTNYKNETTFNKHINLQILTYTNNGHSTLLNDWDNPNYFITAFLTLFPFGIEGHLATNNCSKKTEVSFEAWAK